MRRSSSPVFNLLRPWPSLGVWAGLILVGSSVPMPPGPPVDFPVTPDKIAHCFAYALLAALAVRATWGPRCPIGRTATAIVAVVAYGALLEGWQAVLGNRGCELGDAIANAIGALAGGAAAAGTARARRARDESRRIGTGYGQGHRPEAP